MIAKEASYGTLPSHHCVAPVVAVDCLRCISHRDVRNRAPFNAPSAAELPALDRLLTSGDIQVAQAHLQGIGFDPGPIDGIYSPQTRAAVRSFQQRYGLPVSGLLDRATREELVPGLDPKRTQ
jgi:peptidoglycan hydrolase-like protein with peptidoglycan-binding domain